MTSATPPLLFALPSSMGRRASEHVPRLERFFSDLLYPEYRVEVFVAESYATLTEELIRGAIDLAWAPPLVCARIEANGGSAIVRAVRGGCASFRAALLCHRERMIDPRRPGAVTAAWVDRDSTAGFLLPVGHLLDRRAHLAEERFLGSYLACAEAVADGSADVTSTYASGAQASSPRLGLDRIPEPVRDELRVFAYSAEVPTDAIAARPRFPGALAGHLRRRLFDALETTAGLALLRESLDAEWLEAAPRDSYRGLYDLALAALRTG